MFAIKKLDKNTLNLYALPGAELGSRGLQL